MLLFSHKKMFPSVSHFSTAIFGGVVSFEFEQRIFLFVKVASVESIPGIRTESLVHFYDILVRNAFGNYRTILKEVAYSPVMGTMANYLNSRSLGYSWRQHEDGGLDYPDEVCVG